MSQLRSGSYGHRCKALGWGGYRLFWTVDFKPAGSRIRYPRVISRDTDEAGARRFCKKWGCAMPEAIE